MIAGNALLMHMRGGMRVTDQRAVLEVACSRLAD